MKFSKVLFLLGLLLIGKVFFFPAGAKVSVQKKTFVVTKSRVKKTSSVVSRQIQAPKVFKNINSKPFEPKVMVVADAKPQPQLEPKELIRESDRPLEEAMKQLDALKANEKRQERLNLIFQIEADDLLTDEEIREIVQTELFKNSRKDAKTFASNPDESKNLKKLFDIYVEREAIVSRKNGISADDSSINTFFQLFLFLNNYPKSSSKSDFVAQLRSENPHITLFDIVPFEAGKFE